MRAKDILLIDPEPRAKILSLLWLGIRVLGLGFMIIGIVAAGMMLAIEQGLIVDPHESYTPAQQFDMICQNNGGSTDHAVFHLGGQEYAVNSCVWLNEQGNEASPGTSRSVRPPDSNDTASPFRSEPEKAEIDT